MGSSFERKKNWYGGPRRKWTSLKLITKYTKYIQTVDNGPPTPGKRTAYLAPVDRPGSSYLQRLQVSVGRLPWKPVSDLQGPGGRGLWGWRCNSGEYLMFAFVFIIRKYTFPQMWKG